VTAFAFQIDAVLMQIGDHLVGKRYLNYFRAGKGESPRDTRRR
jgi:hypothetical protein